MTNYKYPIIFQKSNIIQDENGVETLLWSDFFKCRAQINGIGGSEYYVAAQQKSQNDVTFEVRYCKALSNIKSQNTRIVYNGEFYDIKHIDDFMENHVSLKIKAVVKDE